MIRFRLLALFLCAACQGTYAQEITLHHICQAICQIETGTVWIAPGKVEGRWQEGEAGEIGPWQTLPEVAREMGYDPEHIRHSARSCERLFLARMEYLIARTTTLKEAAAAYHGGLRGRNRSYAKAYATRALNLATRLATEQQ